MLRSLVRGSNAALQLGRSLPSAASSVRLQSTDASGDKTEKQPKKPTIWQIDEAKCERLANFGWLIKTCF